MSSWLEILHVRERGDVPGLSVHPLRLKGSRGRRKNWPSVRKEVQRSGYQNVSSVLLCSVSYRRSARRS